MVKMSLDRLKDYIKKSYRHYWRKKSFWDAIGYRAEAKNSSK